MHFAAANHIEKWFSNPIFLCQTFWRYNTLVCIHIWSSEYVQTVSTCTRKYQQNTINHTQPLPINTSMSLCGSTCGKSQSLPNHQEGRDVVVFFQRTSFMETCISSYFLLHILLANNFTIVYQPNSRHMKSLLNCQVTSDAQHPVRSCVSA